MITREHVLTTNHWLERFRDNWTTNPPLRLHTRELDTGGKPEWHPDVGHGRGGTAGGVVGAGGSGVPRAGARGMGRMWGWRAKS